MGIVVPFSLGSNGLEVFGEARVDTGSEYCLFQREIADELQIEVEDGFLVRLSTLIGNFTAYAHTVNLNVLGIRFESTVLFTPAYGTTRNLLGRAGWLNNLHLALTMDDEMIYLNPAYSQENL
ncbi:MAG TPA: aspartyl protease family protein [Blastocatellia bacterium]|nr:aspartyl protease family protein [Blastocatellia bacterium]